MTVIKDCSIHLTQPDAWKPKKVEKMINVDVYCKSIWKQNSGCVYFEVKDRKDAGKDITVENSRFHGDIMDRCLKIDDADNVHVRNSTFKNCGSDQFEDDFRGVRVS